MTPNDHCASGHLIGPLRLLIDTDDAGRLPACLGLDSVVQAVVGRILVPSFI